MNFQHKGNMIYQCNKALELIQKRKLKLAKIILTDILKEYPHDFITNYYMGIIYLDEEEYETAIKYFKRSGSEDKYYLNILYCYVQLNMEKETLELYEKYLKNPIDDLARYSKLKFYLDAKYGNLDEWSLNSYHGKQIHEYQEKRAIEHIKERHVIDNINGSFNPNINIEELFYQVKEHIENNPHDGNFFEKNCTGRFFFYYPNCGTGYKDDLTENRQLEICNYIAAVTDAFNLNILTMYPTLNIENQKICYLKPKVQEKQNIKVKKGIDRFYEKYKNFNI